MLRLAGEKQVIEKSFLILLHRFPTEASTTSTSLVLWEPANVTRGGTNFRKIIEGKFRKSIKAYVFFGLRTSDPAVPAEGKADVTAQGVGWIEAPFRSSSTTGWTWFEEIIELPLTSDLGFIGLRFWFRTTGSATAFIRAEVSFMEVITLE